MPLMLLTLSTVLLWYGIHVYYGYIVSFCYLIPTIDRLHWLPSSICTAEKESLRAIHYQCFYMMLLLCLWLLGSGRILPCGLWSGMQIMLLLAANFYISTSGLICCLRLVLALTIFQMQKSSIVGPVSWSVAEQLFGSLDIEVVFDHRFLSGAFIRVALILPRLNSGFLVSVIYLTWLSRNSRLLILHLLNHCSVNGSFSSVLS